jgi:hypothetical protein
MYYRLNNNFNFAYQKLRTPLNDIKSLVSEFVNEIKQYKATKLSDIFNCSKKKNYLIT